MPPRRDRAVYGSLEKYLPLFRSPRGCPEMLRRGGDAIDSIRGVTPYASGVNGIVSVGDSVAFYVPLLEYPHPSGVRFILSGLNSIVHGFPVHQPTGFVPVYAI